MNVDGENPKIAITQKAGMNIVFESRQLHASLIFSKYRISANSFRGNYSFLKPEVRPLFKGGNYSREETIK